LFLDKAHTEHLRMFIRAYRALPNEKFETVGTKTDPVAVRTLEKDGKRYCYAMNRDYYPVDVEIAFNADPGQVQDLATGKSAMTGQHWRFTVGPYMLQVFAVAPNVQIAGFTAIPPEDVVHTITDETDRAIEAVVAARKAGLSIPGINEMEFRMREALGEGRVAWLRRALTSYVVRKCRSREG
jgi:hypothetical protein